MDTDLHLISHIFIPTRPQLAKQLQRRDSIHCTKIKVSVYLLIEIIEFMIADLLMTQTFQHTRVLPPTCIAPLTEKLIC